MTLKEFLKSIADAIREKTNTEELIKAMDFPEKILEIQSGGGELNDEYDLILNGYYTIIPSYLCDQILNGAYTVEMN